MTLRQEMLRAAGRATKSLGAARRDAAAKFVLGQQDASGAWKNRQGKPDLYYTVFGIDCAIALGLPVSWAAVKSYMETLGDVAGMDLAHTACMCRAWAAIGQPMPADLSRRIVERIESFRCADGGFHHFDKGPCGSAYGSFVAMGAYEDLGARMPNVEGVLASLASLGRADGSFCNEPDMPASSLSTSAAAAVLAHLGRPLPPGMATWLLSCHQPEGGFAAFLELPMADLLSTATTIHALAAIGAPLDAVAEATGRYVQSLLTPAGGFAGSQGDPTPDVEYTFYGLLAAGHLACAQR